MMGTLTRRHLCLMTATAALLPATGSAADPEPRRGEVPMVTLLVAIGPRLVGYRPDTDAMTLAAEPEIDLTVPAAIQYVWRHPKLPVIYIAYSDRVGAGPGGRVHGVQAGRIDGSGRITSLGEPLRLDNRPINITVDGTGHTLLVACNMPSALFAYPLSADGRIGPMIMQPEAIDAGIFAHQVRVAPDDRTVILVTRGNDAGQGKPEDPGALKVFDMEAGRLRLRQSVAPNGGYGFGPRHLDFALGRPLAYVSMERENVIETFAMTAQGLSSAPLFRSTTLGQPARPGLRQLAGAIHVSADNRFVYIANRADSRRKVDGRSVFAGGENTMAVFRVDPVSGEPVLIQTIETARYHPRTFCIHPHGTMLVSAAVDAMPVLDGDRVRCVSAGLTVFRVAPDGTLARAQQIDIENHGETVFWCGMVPH